MCKQLRLCVYVAKPLGYLLCVPSMLCEDFVLGLCYVVWFESVIYSYSFILTRKIHSWLYYFNCILAFDLRLYVVCLSLAMVRLPRGLSWSYSICLGRNLDLTSFKVKGETER